MLDVANDIESVRTQTAPPSLMRLPIKLEACKEKCSQLHVDVLFLCESAIFRSNKIKIVSNYGNRKFPSTNLRHGVTHRQQ